MVKSGVTWGQVRMQQERILAMLHELDTNLAQLNAPPSEIMALGRLIEAAEAILGEDGA